MDNDREFDLVASKTAQHAQLVKDWLKDVSAAHATFVTAVGKGAPSDHPAAISALVCAIGMASPEEHLRDLARSLHTFADQFENEDAAPVGAHQLELKITRFPLRVVNEAISKFPASSKKNECSLSLAHLGPGPRLHVAPRKRPADSADDEKEREIKRLRALLNDDRSDRERDRDHLDRPKKFFGRGLASSLEAYHGELNFHVGSPDIPASPVDLRAFSAQSDRTADGWIASINKAGWAVDPCNDLLAGKGQANLSSAQAVGALAGASGAALRSLVAFWEAQASNLTPVLERTPLLQGSVPLVDSLVGEFIRQLKELVGMSALTARLTDSLCSFHNGGPSIALVYNQITSTLKSHGLSFLDESPFFHQDGSLRLSKDGSAFVPATPPSVPFNIDTALQNSVPLSGVLWHQISSCQAAKPPPSLNSTCSSCSGKGKEGKGKGKGKGKGSKKGPCAVKLEVEGDAVVVVIEVADE